MSRERQLRANIGGPTRKKPAPPPAASKSNAPIDHRVACLECYGDENIGHKCIDGTRVCGCPDVFETTKITARATIRVRVSCKHTEAQ